MITINWINILLICIILCLVIVVVALLIYNYFLLPDSSNSDSEKIKTDIAKINEFLDKFLIGYPYQEEPQIT